MTAGRYAPRVLDAPFPAVYPDAKIRSIKEYWRRFADEPDLAGSAVLELGCGNGAMAVHLAQKGARRVVGVDISAQAIESANKLLVNGCPELAPTIEYVHCDVADLVEDQFDAVVSKDAFEHVEDLDNLLFQLYRRLRPGGRLYAGFSPLYFSPFGDHGRTRFPVPWAHAFLPAGGVLRWASWRRKAEVRSLHDLGLNGWTPADFRNAFDRSLFEVDSILYNRGDKPLLRVLSRARVFPPAEKFCTVSMYVVLRRD